MTVSSRLIVALLATLAFAGTAVGAGKEDKKLYDQAKAARAACLMGDYQKGTKILVDLFIETGNPVHIFNQGRCYEQNHRWEEAVDRFHEYLRKAPKLDAETKAYVDKHLAESESHLLNSAAVGGGKRDKTKSQKDAARAACLMGDYQKGTKILVDLFIQTGDPVHIFNQGRCYEQNHRWEEAVDRFHEYLRKAPKLDAETKAYVDKHLAESESHLLKAAVVQPPPPPSPTPSAPPHAQVETSAPQVVHAVTSQVTTQSVERPSEKTSGFGLRVTGIVAGGLGVAGIVAGVLLNAKVNEMASDLEKPGKYSDSTESNRKTYEIWGWVSYGLGAACLTTGAVLYLVGHASTQPSSVALVPSIGPGQASAVLRGSRRQV
jgi:tetratricopeptide (TPR) repeat protein